MKLLSCIVALGLSCGALYACERNVPTAGDASTTSATPTGGEQPIEPTTTTRPTAVAPPTDAGAGITHAPTEAGAGRPSWVPKDASLTIVSARDRDRNIGVVPPLPTAIAIDAGNVQLDIQVRGKP